jgi:hypothetical protein
MEQLEQAEQDGTSGTAGTNKLLIACRRIFDWQKLINNTPETIF